MKNFIRQLLGYRNLRPITPPRTIIVHTIQMLDGTHVTNKATMVDHLPDGTIKKAEVIFCPDGCTLLLDGILRYYNKEGERIIV